MRYRPDYSAVNARASPAVWRDAPRIGLRARVWALSLELDRRLAEGVSPTNSHELSLRAHQLTRLRARRALSEGLTSAVETAGRRRPHWTAAVPLVTEGVLEAADTLQCLAHDLTAVADPSVRGVALASFLMCDGAASPLYNRRSPVTVLDIAQRARSALRHPERRRLASHG